MLKEELSSLCRRDAVRRLPKEDEEVLVYCFRTRGEAVVPMRDALRMLVLAHLVAEPAPSDAEEGYCILFKNGPDHNGQDRDFLVRPLKTSHVTIAEPQ